MPRRHVVFGFAALMLVTASVSAQDVVKDRKAYLPSRKHVALPATVVGVLLSDGQPVLSTEGRSGPADQLVFSSGGNSYRWIYVPTQGNAQITNLQVAVGNKGERVVYPALNLANPPAVLGWGVKSQYSLVELEVNDGRGSPAEDAFVATKCKVLDGTKEYPLKVVEVIFSLKDRYAEYLSKQQKTIDQAMKDAGDKALKGRTATGPREKKDLMYVTWLPETSTMRVHFKTTLSDGAYQTIGGGANPGNPRPNPLPLPPIPKRKMAFADPFETHFVLRAAPPKGFQVKIGTTFGIEFGRAYVVNKNGEVTATEDLPIESFSHELNAPPRGRPDIDPPVKNDR